MVRITQLAVLQVALSPELLGIQKCQNELPDRRTPQIVALC